MREVDEAAEETKPPIKEQKIFASGGRQQGIRQSNAEEIDNAIAELI